MATVAGTEPGRDTEGFAGLMLRLRGRTQLTQRDVARSLGVHVRSVQLWEASASHPNAQRLQALIRVLLDGGGFDTGVELAEAEALWLAAMSESPRLNTAFDGAWFQRLLSNHQVQRDGSAATPPLTQQARRYWGSAPDVAGFLGRAGERATLRRWVVDDGCRLVAITGMGGIGKSILASRIAHDLEPQFTTTHWRSLHNAPTFAEWLAGVIGFVSPRDPVLTSTEDAQLNRLLEVLTETRCLLVLDNLETVLQPGQHTGEYLPGYAQYGALLKRIASTPHRGCLVLTSREEPPELGPLKGESGPIRSLTLSGLAVAEARTLLRDKDLRGDDAVWHDLVNRYAGNGLALRLIGESIHELFDGDIAAYAADVALGHGALFGGVRQLLEAQVQRLSELEQQLMRRLAVAREPLSFAELASNLGPGTSRGDVREAVEALLRRSLLERRQPGSLFTLHAVVLEFVTGALVEEVAQELAHAAPFRLRDQPLLKATAKDYVRRSQERLIASPVVDRFVVLMGTRRAAERQLIELLDRFRQQPLDAHGYAPGNIINVLRLVRGNLRHVDASGLLIRQAYLPDVEAQDTTFAGSDLSESVLAEAFHQISVALSPDGEHLLAGTTTGQLCLWRAADRTLLLSADGHAGMVWRVALCVAHGLIASASEDGTVRLWESSSGQPLATLRGHCDFVQGVAISADGSLVASASQDGTIRLWRAPSGELLRTLEYPHGGVLSVVLSNNGRQVVGGTQVGQIATWDIKSGQLTEAYDGHTGPVPGLSLSADGKLMASASLDGTARLWSVATHQPRAILSGHVGGVWDVALSAADDLVASAGQDGTVRLWSARGQPLTTLVGHTGQVWGVSLSADGLRVASAGQDGTVRLFDTSTRQLLTTLRGHTAAVWDVALSADARVAASANQDGTVSIWDASTGELQHRLGGHSAIVVSVALSNNGKVLASASQGGNVRVWDAETGELRTTLVGHGPGTIWHVALNANGTLVVSAGFDGTVRLWDARNGAQLGALIGHSRGVRGVAVNDARRMIVSGSQDGTLKLWSMDDGRISATLPGHTGSVQSVAADHAGRVVVSGGFDGTVKLWDATTGECIRTLTAHTGAVLCVVISADGRLVASGGFDRTVKLWDVATGNVLETYAAHAGAVRGLALSVDGYVLASGSLDGTIKLWDVPSGSFRRTLQADRPYERMDVTGVTGLTPANRAALAALGAVDSIPGRPSAERSGYVSS